MKYNLFLLLIITLFSCKKVETSLCESLDVSQDANKKNRNVLIIGLDGFRADGMQSSITPFMYSLSQSANTYFTSTTRTEINTLSGPNWASLLTGVHQDKHLVENNGFTNNVLANYPHFIYYVEQANPQLKTISLVHWTPINLIITKNFADYAPLEGGTDSLINENANAFLSPSSSENPDVLFLHFDDLDYNGHATGYSPDSINYRQTLTRIDSYVQELFTSIENRRANGEDWMVFIVSDHGGYLTDHGIYPDNPDVFNTIFFANHPSMKFTDDLKNEQVNLVPTIFDYLGIKSPKFECYTDGKSLIKN